MKKTILLITALLLSACGESNAEKTPKMDQATMDKLMPKQVAFKGKLKRNKDRDVAIYELPNVTFEKCKKVKNVKMTDYKGKSAYINKLSAAELEPRERFNVATNSISPIDRSFDFSYSLAANTEFLKRSLTICKNVIKEINGWILEDKSKYYSKEQYLLDWYQD